MSSAKKSSHLLKKKELDSTPLKHYPFWLVYRRMVCLTSRVTKWLILLQKFHLCELVLGKWKKVI